MTSMAIPDLTGVPVSTMVNTALFKTQEELREANDLAFKAHEKLMAAMKLSLSLQERDREYVTEFNEAASKGETERAKVLAKKLLEGRKQCDGISIEVLKLLRFHKRMQLQIQKILLTAIDFLETAKKHSQESLTSQSVINEHLKTLNKWLSENLRRIKDDTEVEEEIERNTSLARGVAQVSQ